MTLKLHNVICNTRKKFRRVLIFFARKIFAVKLVHSPSMRKRHALLVKRKLRVIILLPNTPPP